MDTSVLGTLFRQWKVVVPILALAVVAAVVLQLRMEPIYQASGSALLASPALDPSRTTEAAIDADQVLRDFSAPGEGYEPSSHALVEVRLLDRTTIELSSNSPSPVAAEQALTDGIDWLHEHTESVQDSERVSDNDRLEWRLLTPDHRATVDATGRFATSAVLWLEGLTSSAENPYGTGRETASILRIEMMSDRGRDAVRESLVGDVDFHVSPPHSKGLPVLPITTSGTDADEVLDGFGQVVDAANAELNDRQARAEVPPTGRITLDVIDRPATAQQLNPGLSGTARMTLVLGLLLAIVVSAIAETTWRSRAANTAAASGPPAPANVPLDPSTLREPTSHGR